MATPFHRLARETPEYGWWRLPAAGLIGFAGYIAVLVVIGIVAVLAAVSFGPDQDRALDNWLDESTQLDLLEPGFFAFAMILIALMLPAIWLAVLICGPRPVGYLTSVEGRMRWRWLGRLLLIAFAIYGVTLAVTIAVTGMTDSGAVTAPRTIDTGVVVAIVLVLTLTPLQATAEEYVFRGYLLQLVGSWSRFAIVPILVSTPVFVAGHTYDVWGLLDVGLFGLLAAWLTIRTGGLEAAIAAHVANNVVLLLVDALGILRTADAETGPLALLPTIVTSVVMALVTMREADRLQIVRFRPVIEPPPPPLAPMWPPVPYAMPWPAQWQQPYHPQQYPPNHYPPQPQYQQPYYPQPQYGPPQPQYYPQPPLVEPPPYPGDEPPGWGGPPR